MHSSSILQCFSFFIQVSAKVLVAPYRTPPRIYDVEGVQKYVVGEYHPVNIHHWPGNGDRRHKVVRNLVPSSVDKRSYALKAMCVNCSTDNQQLEKKCINSNDHSGKHQKNQQKNKKTMPYWTSSMPKGREARRILSSKFRPGDPWCLWYEIILGILCFPLDSLSS